MKIAILLDKKGNEIKSNEHLIMADKKELAIFIEVFEVYCIRNKNRKKTKEMLDQFNDSFQIY